MKTALLLLLFCLAEADDIRWEFQSFKSQLEGQLAALTLEVTDLTLEVTQLKSEVKKLKWKTADQCPSGWTKFGDSCYYYMSTEKKTWQQSRVYCQNKGADLVVINSGEEQDFVDRLVVGGKVVWLGLTDSEREGVWKWVDGTTLTTPTYWHPGQPNDHGGREDCAEFHNGGWNDDPCAAYTHNWMCEIVF